MDVLKPKPIVVEKSMSIVKEDYTSKPLYRELENALERITRCGRHKERLICIVNYYTATDLVKIKQKGKRCRTLFCGDLRMTESVSWKFLTLRKPLVVNELPYSGLNKIYKF